MAAALITACHRAPLPASQQAGPAGERLPSLILDHLSSDVETTPMSTAGSFETGPTGALIFYADEGDRLALTLVDSTGSGRRRFGAMGDGPGEVRRPRPLWVDDSIIVLGDVNLARLSVFGLDGTFRSAVAVHGAIISALAASPGAMVTLLGTAQGMQPALVTIASGEIRPLITHPDSFMRAAFGDSGRAGQGPVPVLGRWSEGFVLADVWNYRLALYGWDGVLRTILARDLPRPRLSNARIDTLLRRATARPNYHPGAAADSSRERDLIAAGLQPYLTPNRHLGFDGEGRIWVFGMAGDSGFADLFSRDRFLGRIPLSCPGFEGMASVAGHRVALSCGVADRTSDAASLVKVYRIADAPIP